MAPYLRAIMDISQWYNPVSVTEWIMSVGLRVLVIIVVALVFNSLIGGLVSRLLTVKARRQNDKRFRTLSKVAHKTVSVVTALLATLMILQEIGINITPLLTGAGILGLAIGFGAQETVKNFLQGLFILLEDQYAEGDMVEVAGVTGRVAQFDLRHTVLTDSKGVRHHIPNGEIKVVTNKSQVKP